MSIVISCVPINLDLNIRNNILDYTICTMNVQVAYKIPRLSKTAVPCVFSTSAEFGGKEAISLTDNQTTLQVEHIKEDIDPNLPDECSTGNTVIPDVSVLNKGISTDPLSEAKTNSGLQESFESPPMHTASQVNTGSISNMDFQDDNINRTEDHIEDSSSFQDMFLGIFADANAVKIPFGWYRYTSRISNKWVAFSSFDTKCEQNCLHPLPRKSVLITEEGDVHASANGKTIPIENICCSLERIGSVDDLSHLVSTLATTRLCSGAQLSSNDCVVQHRMLYQDAFGNWRHKECSIVSKSRICPECQRLKKSMNQIKRRSQKQSNMIRIHSSHMSLEENSKIIAMRKRLRSEKAAARRAKERVEILKEKMHKMQVHLRKMTK